MRYPTEQQIKVIAEHIIKRSTASNKTDFPAGVTYLGQFIAHDIIPSSTANQQARRNIRPYLMLDSLYGERRGNSYIGLNEQGLFSYVAVTDNNNLVGYDFHRILHGNSRPAFTPEPRNDENIIVSQLTIFWQRLHNYLMNRSVGSDIAQNIENARELTIKTFQLVVVEYFARSVMNKEAYDYYFTTSTTTHYWLNNLIVPLDFFNLASFRFGHSLIRDNYTLAAGPKNIEIKNILNKNNHLKPSHVLDWSRLFNVNQPTLALDVSFSETMTTISNGNIPAVNIIKRNLNRGEILSLGFGASWFDRLQRTIPTLLPTAKRLSSRHYNNAFSGLDFMDIESLPLWLYILLEAETQEEGKKLGVFGSVLNLEVLRLSVKDAPISVFTNNAYSFNSAISNMGEWGQMLQESLSTDAHLTMLNIINLTE